MSKPRTAGDGMECNEPSQETGLKTAVPKSARNSTDKDAPLSGRLIQVFATNVIRVEKKKTPIHTKSPKFVPYEPYAAAVKPITPHTVTKGTKKSKNNMDINTLISQMSQMKTDLNEFKPRQKLTSTNSEKSLTETNTCPEKEEMQKKISELMKENELLNEQLKQQVQVKIRYSYFLFSNTNIQHILIK